VGFGLLNFCTLVVYFLMREGLKLYVSGCFGGLEVACWPLIPKFVGSRPAEAVGFLG
jgi:hypothetical protein